MQIHLDKIPVLNPNFRKKKKKISLSQKYRTQAQTLRRPSQSAQHENREWLFHTLRAVLFKRALEKFSDVLMQCSFLESRHPAQQTNALTKYAAAHYHFTAELKQIKPAPTPELVIPGTL